MTFMKPEYLKGDWHVVDGSHGGACIPASVCGFCQVGDYYEGEVWTVETHKDKIGVRLSAPGYMDATDWTIFDTIEEARAYIEEQYEVDADTGDDIED